MLTFCPGLYDFSTCSTRSSEIREMCTYAPMDFHFFSCTTPSSPSPSAAAAAAAAARRSRRPCPRSVLTAGALPATSLPSSCSVDGTFIEVLKSETRGKAEGRSIQERGERQGVGVVIIVQSIRGVDNHHQASRRLSGKLSMLRDGIRPPKP